MAEIAGKSTIADNDRNDNEVKIKVEEAVKSPTGAVVESLYMSTQATGSSYVPSIINMMNTIVGAGTLSLSFTFHSSGVITSLILLIISYLASVLGAHMLVTAAVYTKEDSYGFIGKKLVNKTVAISSDVTMILFDFGIAVAYLNILFAQIMDLLASWTSISSANLDKWKFLICIVAAFAFCFPVLCTPTLDKLKFTSAIAIMCIVGFFFMTVFMGIKQLSTEPLEYNMFPQSGYKLAQAVSVFFTCLASHVNIPKMVFELRLPSTTKYKSKIAKMDHVNWWAFTLCTVIYTVVGLLGYFAYGPNVKSNLLSNFATDKIAILDVVKVAYALVVLFSYPILSFPALVSLDKMLFKSTRSTSRRVIECFIWTVLATVVALFVTTLSDIFGLTGSLCGVLLVFVWPALFYVYIHKKETAKEPRNRLPLFLITTPMKNISIFLVVFGAIASIAFTAIQVKDTWFK